MVRLHTVGLVLTIALAQIALLLGVAGDRPRLRVVLWPTVALALVGTRSPAEEAPLAARLPRNP